VINAILKASHNKHTGHLRPHEHTSYVPLAILIVFVGAILASFSVSAFAADPGPQAGSVGLTGVVPTSPPTIAATITSPTGQQQFSTSPITVSGKCPTGILVEIFENNIFAGSTPCNSNGTYSLDINLLYGQNSIVAQVYDVLNQSGPISKPVNITYTVPPLQTASISTLNFSGTQLLLNTDAVYRGAFPNQAITLPITILGGTPPYALNINWGDSTNKVVSENNNTVFNVSHSYQKPGTYKITLQGSDNQQQVAFLTVAAIINGQPDLVSSSNTSTGSTNSKNELLVLWPLYAIAVTLVAGFWIGEVREKHHLNAIAKSRILPTNPLSHVTS
jgi:hypothetical protein